MFGFTAGRARDAAASTADRDGSAASSKISTALLTASQRSGVDPQRATCSTSCASRTGASSSATSRRTGSARASSGASPASATSAQSVRTAEALEQHRAFLEKAQEVAHIGSWVAELDGSDRARLVGRNAPHLRRAARRSSTARREAFFAFVHPDDRDAVRAAQPRRRRQAAPPYDIEHRIVRGRRHGPLGAREGRRPARRRRPADAHGRHGAGHHRPPPARGSAAAVAEDGGDRPARRRHRARSQQRARPRSPATRSSRSARSPRTIAARADVEEIRTRGRARRIGDAPAARLQPQAAARAARLRSERHRRRTSRGCCRGCSAPTSHVQTAAGRPSLPVLGDPGPGRAGGHQPRGQRARRDAGGRPARR